MPETLFFLFLLALEAVCAGLIPGPDPETYSMKGYVN